MSASVRCVPAPATTRMAVFALTNAPHAHVMHVVFARSRMLFVSTAVLSCQYACAAATPVDVTEISVGAAGSVPAYSEPEQAEDPALLLAVMQYPYVLFDTPVSL